MQNSRVRYALPRFEYLYLKMSLEDLLNWIFR